MIDSVALDVFYVPLRFLPAAAVVPTTVVEESTNSKVLLHLDELTLVPESTKADLFLVDTVLLAPPVALG